MLKVAYIATQQPPVKPEKLTEKQILIAAADEHLAIRKHLDMMKAKTLFMPEREKLETLKESLRELKSKP